jgi:hypothetical protein
VPGGVLRTESFAASERPFEPDPADTGVGNGPFEQLLRAAPLASLPRYHFFHYCAWLFTQQKEWL